MPARRCHSEGPTLLSQRGLCKSREPDGPREAPAGKRRDGFHTQGILCVRLQAGSPRGLRTAQVTVVSAFQVPALCQVLYICTVSI